MRETVDDLRILRLAQMYESAYEHFVQDVAMRHADAQTRERLSALEPPLDRHAQRLEQHAERIRKTLSASDAPEIVASILADVVEVERAAREFYFQNAGRIHDPALATLFHELAHEESRHQDLAQDALDDYRRRAGLSREAVPAPNNELPVLWEGTGDFGRVRPK